MRGEKPGHTLQPTALVNEAWLKLNGWDGADWNDRAHFLAIVAQAMREILVEHARRRNAIKRGGNAQRIDFDERLAVVAWDMDRIIAVHELIEQLKEWEPRQAQVVELRFFLEMSEEEVAAVLRVQPRTVRRDWRMAKAWLRGQIDRPPQ